MAELVHSEAFNHTAIIGANGKSARCAGVIWLEVWKRMERRTPLRARASACGVCREHRTNFAEDCTGQSAQKVNLTPVVAIQLFSTASRTHSFCLLVAVLLVSQHTAMTALGAKSVVLETRLNGSTVVSVVSSEVFSEHEVKNAQPNVNDASSATSQ